MWYSGFAKTSYNCKWPAWWAGVSVSLMVICDQVMVGTANPSDIHGGVQMGVSNHQCDDAKTNLGMDWDPRIPGADIEYQCPGNNYLPVTQIPPELYCQATAAQPLHKCMYEPIHYPDTPPLSGAHRPLWPVYGEYRYLPPQRWLHSMEHGAVVLLYHPCADKKQLNLLKTVVRSCLRRHIITPYRHLPSNTPFALLTWKCKLTLSYADKPAAEKFIKDHAILPAPESSVYDDGQYGLELIRRAEIVSDIQDSRICRSPHSLSQNSNYRFPLWASDLSEEMMGEIIPKRYLKDS